MENSQRKEFAEITCNVINDIIHLNPKFQEFKFKIYMFIYSTEDKPIYESILSENSYSYFENKLDQSSVAPLSVLEEAIGELSLDSEGAIENEHMTEYLKDETKVYS